MFFEKQLSHSKQRYAKLLKIVASLSKLNSDKNEPYLYYRMAENIFCEAFEADNLSRSDISVDAKQKHFGIGLKTFSYRNGKVLEKIAEFNANLSLYSGKNDKEICKIVSELRNDRISFACNACDIDSKSLLYHCVSRESNFLHLHEEPMAYIDINNINSIKNGKNTILFNDKLNEYSFNISKSTLFKRFIVKPIQSIKVTILDNPFEMLENCFKQNRAYQNPIIGTIVLPLYSTKNHEVPEKSGLNQWNASGRVRNEDEVYIPIPAILHKLKPNFFPNRDTNFSLRLPNGNHLSVKVCQDNSKALMSNPNKALGDWILRDVLKLKKGVILTYKYLQNIGVDSVEITKFEDLTYAINFKKLGSFEEFLESFS